MAQLYILKDATNKHYSQDCAESTLSINTIPAIARYNVFFYTKTIAPIVNYHEKMGSLSGGLSVKRQLNGKPVVIFLPAANKTLIMCG